MAERDGYHLVRDFTCRQRALWWFLLVSDFISSWNGSKIVIILWETLYRHEMVQRDSYHLRDGISSWDASERWLSSSERLHLVVRWFREMAIILWETTLSSDGQRDVHHPVRDFNLSPDGQRDGYHIVRLLHCRQRLIACPGINSLAGWGVEVDGSQGWGAW